MPPHLPQILKPYVTAAAFKFSLIDYANRSLNLWVWMVEVQKHVWIYERDPFQGYQLKSWPYIMSHYFLSSTHHPSVIRWIRLDSIQINEQSEFEEGARCEVFIHFQCLHIKVIGVFCNQDCMSCIADALRINIFFVRCVSITERGYLEWICSDVCHV